MAASLFSLPAGLPADPSLLAALLDLLPMGVMYYTPVVDAAGTLTDLTLVYLNPAAQRMTQLPAQPGTTYRQQFPTTDENGAWEFHRRSWLGPEPGQFQFYYDVDGFDAYFRVTAQRLGEGLLTIFTDTQDEVRSQAELALLASQTRERAARAEAEAQQTELRAVFEQAPVAISLLQGPAHVIEFANSRMAQLWGRPLAEVVGQPHFAVLPDLAGQGFEELCAAVWRTGQPYYLQEQAVTLHRAGQPYQGYFNITYQPSYNGQGQRTGIITSAIEVTEQVRARQQMEQFNQELEARVQQRTQVAEQALAEAERQRRSTVELVRQAPAAMCVLSGPDFIYEAFNPLYAAMFQGRPQLGRPLREVLPEVVNYAEYALLQVSYTEGRTFRQSEVAAPIARSSDGVLEDRYFSYTQQPRYNSQGQIDGVFIFAVEVTEQVQARQQVQALNEELTATNEELNQSNTQLTRTNVDLDTFVYTASHDLKAPITNIEGITLALRDTLSAAAQQDDMTSHLLDLLEQTTARFQATIGQLTDLSKLQLAHAGPAEPVHLAAVIEAVRLDLAPAIVAAEVRLSVAVAPELVVSFSPANLRSAIYNLLSNAIKYRALDRPAQVWVRAFVAGPDVAVEVQDNGLGLNAHQQQRLFGLFQRLHTHVEGTGVGLYITKRLVENGGGSIAVQSQVDVGTTFALTFPA